MDHQYYGLTEAGEMLVLPKAEYSSTALREWANALEAAVKPVPTLQIILDEHAYQVIYSHLDAEIEDRDGDGQIPHYLCISLQTQLPVFPHPSVDTPAEIAEFLQSYPTPLTNGVALTDAKQNWPEPQWADAVNA